MGDGVILCMCQQMHIHRMTCPSSLHTRTLKCPHALSLLATFKAGAVGGHIWGTLCASTAQRAGGRGSGAYVSCVCGWVGGCVRACVRACVCACVRARVRAVCVDREAVGWMGRFSALVYVVQTCNMMPWRCRHVLGQANKIKMGGGGEGLRHWSQSDAVQGTKRNKIG